MKKIIVWMLLTAVLFAAMPMTAFAEIMAEDAARKLPSGIAYADVEKTIDSYVNDRKDTTAAMSVAIFDRDGVILEKSYGYINVEDKIANNADAVFEWGSVGKLLVWVSAMQLYEQGKLDLNADVKTYLPDGFFKKLKYDDKITMLNLMNHNAGWQDFCKDLFIADRENVPDLETALKKTEPYQIFRPGEYAAYSNWGAALAGYIVERISGVPFYEYAQTNIFTPLDMTKTALKPDLSDNAWVKERRQKLMCYTSNMKALGSCSYASPFYPSGQETGTISDYRKFAMALIPDENGESPLFQKAETLAGLLTPSMYFPDGKTASCYHGLWTEPIFKSQVIGHTGQTIGCVANLKIDLEAGVGMITMVNQPDASDYILSMPSQIFEKRAFTPNADLHSDVSIAGIYYKSEGFVKGIARFFSILDGRLPISKDKDGSLSISEFSLNQVEPDVYAATRGDASTLFYVKRDGDGNVKSLVTGSREFIPTSQGAYYFDLFLLICLAITGLYGFITLLVMFIRKLRKKDKIDHNRVMGSLRAAVCGAALGAAVNFAVLILTALSMIIPSAQLIVHGLLFILFMLIPVVYAVILAVRFKGLDADKKQKGRLIATAIMGLLMTFSVAFLHLWWFWA
ncbi:MAG: beta-lactamase family protein [Firmicutes bacterium]|nr:beta-lactamase family protein [Bacillota bacterium]